MGYYDRFLKRLFATPDISRDAVTLVGLAFHEQMVADDELPMDDHDFLLDQVITSDWSENNKGTRFQMKRILFLHSNSSPFEQGVNRAKKKIPTQQLVDCTLNNTHAGQIVVEWWEWETIYNLT